MNHHWSILRFALVTFAAACSLTARADSPSSAAAPADPAVTEIIDKNVAARGGLEAWRKVQTMAWTGHMESAHAPVSSVPFLLMQKRPNKTRFELNTLGQTSLRMFDGAEGWKLQPNRNGGPSSYTPYTAQELKFAQDAEGLDGPLIDYRAKGIKVALEGVEEVEGHKAYRLRVQLPSGSSHHIWIDAQTFLELKYDRTSYDNAGKAGIVAVFYRNYQNIDGLQIPATIEIGGGTGQVPDRMVIEKVSLNPPIDDRAFKRGGMMSGLGGPMAGRSAMSGGARGRMGGQGGGASSNHSSWSASPGAVMPNPTPSAATPESPSASE